MEGEADLETVAGARPVEDPEVGAAGPMVAVVETLGPAGPRGVVPGDFVGAVAPMRAVAESPLVAAETMGPVGAASVLEADPSLDASAAGVAAHVPMGAELELLKMVAPEPGPMEAEPVFGLVLVLEPDPIVDEFEAGSRCLSGAVVGPGQAVGSSMGAVGVIDC